MKNYKLYIYSFGVILVIISLFYFLGEIILPFLIGLIGAFMVEPLVKRIQQLIPNRRLAVSTFLALSISFFMAILLLFGSEIVHDVKRLNNAFQTFAQDHHETIDETNETIKSYLQELYDSEQVQEGIHQAEVQSDSIQNSPMEHLKTAWAGITSFLGSDKKEIIQENDDQTSGLNWMLIFLSAIVYFLYIIYSFGYFEDRYKKYVDSDLKKNSFVKQFTSDFRRIFLLYFRKRTEVVLICFLIFLISFLIMDLPGAILIAFLSALLCYIPHFHYITLIPISLSCWVLSMETGTGFYVFLGVAAGIFVLISILEEVVFTPRIMKDFNGLNPAIMIVSFAVWTYFFGAVVGTFIALPLTTVILIYLDQLLLHTKKVLIERDHDARLQN